MVQACNSDLKLIANWSNYNKLIVNISKTKALCIGSPCLLMKEVCIRKPDVLINKEKVQWVKQFNYLGVIIDEKVNFDSCISNMHRKAAFRLKTLSLIRNSILEHWACCILKSMLYSYFDYRNIVYTFSTEKNVNKLQKIMNTALRLVFHTNRFTSVTELHRRAKMMSVKDRIQFNLLKFAHRQVRLGNPLFSFVDAPATRATSHKIVKLLRPKTTKFKRSPYYSAIQYWNQLDNDLRSISDPVIFKLRLKSHFLGFQ